ncbi:hypothetical protein DVH24_008040 [Malus domestica]|uniref:RNase H type-1 domain-containing protein n=1 Tax=Malus domestica TaxID=3750 RepID=A0A498JJ20_MALDO|nr:hypothetical protein DVH24_008040 [Malus domestica]
MIKINVDASWKADASVGYVGVVRDSRKMLEGRKGVHASSATVVAAFAVLEGCLLAQQSNYYQIVVESDYKQIISYLNGGCRFQNCIWSKVVRSVNEVAKFVARFSGVEMSDSV